MNIGGAVGEPMNTNSFRSALSLIAKRAGVKFTSHDGRDIVQTAFENIGVVRNQIQKIKGRKVRGEDAPYSKPETEKLRQKYREALPELEFLTEEVGSQKLEDLEGQIIEKNKLISNLLQNSSKKERDFQKLKEKVALFESTKPALEALLKRVEELETKLKT
jgi:hypothetical protein